MPPFFGLLLLVWAPDWLAILKALPILERAGVSASAGLFVTSLLIYPALEELVFRTWLMPQIQQWLSASPVGMARLGLTKRRTVAHAANFLGSVIFSICHWPVNGGGVALAVLLPSLVLGLLYQRHYSYLLNTAIHGYWNLLFLLLAMRWV